MSTTSQRSNLVLTALLALAGLLGAPAPSSALS